MRPGQGKSVILSEPPASFDDGDPHLRPVSRPPERGVWSIERHGARVRMRFIGRPQARRPRLAVVARAE